MSIVGAWLYSFEVVVLKLLARRNYGTFVCLLKVTIVGY